MLCGALLVSLRSRQSEQLRNRLIEVSPEQSAGAFKRMFNLAQNVVDPMCDVFDIALDFDNCILDLHERPYAEHNRDDHRGTDSDNAPLDNVNGFTQAFFAKPLLLFRVASFIFTPESLVLFATCFLSQDDVDDRLQLVRTSRCACFR